MRLANLDTLIVLEQESRVSDDRGGFVTSWETFAANLWAKVDTISGTNRFFASQEMSDATDQFTIRAVEGVTEKLRVRLVQDNRVFYVRGVEDLKKDPSYILLICSSRKRETDSA